MLWGHSNYTWHFFVTLFSFKSLIFMQKLLWNIKWIRNKVSFEALSCIVTKNFPSQTINNRALISKKRLCDISANPLPFLSVTYYLNDPFIHPRIAISDPVDVWFLICFFSAFFLIGILYRLQITPPYKASMSFWGCEVVMKHKMYQLLW
jgi:hypothetical protein